MGTNIYKQILLNFETGDIISLMFYYIVNINVAKNSQRTIKFDYKVVNKFTSNLEELFNFFFKKKNSRRRVIKNATPKCGLHQNGVSKKKRILF